jgi:hypothetical protein
LFGGEVGGLGGVEVLEILRGLVLTDDVQDSAKSQPL